MKFTLLLLFVIAIETSSGQTAKDFYPTLQPVKYKQKKNDYGAMKFSFDGCVSGDCKESEGVYIKMGQPYYFSDSYGNTEYRTQLTMQQGKFSEGGKIFTGKEYIMPVAYSYQDGKAIPKNTFLFSDANAMQKYLSGEGSQFSNKWQGIVKRPALDKKFTHLKTHQFAYEDDKLVWADMEFKPGGKIIRYTGRVWETGDMLAGKAMLNDGSVYEGFFVKGQFFGPGKLTLKNGKTKEGIWQPDSLVIPVPVSFPAFLFDQRLPVEQKINIDMLGANSVYNDFYGTAVNTLPEGWGMANYNFKTASNWNNYLIYGYWKNGKLDGPAVYFKKPEELKYNGSFKEEWIGYTAGIFQQNEWQRGVLLQSKTSNLYNKELQPGDILNQQFYGDVKIINGSLAAGCRTQITLSPFDLEEGKYKPLKKKEGWYADNDYKGWYYEGDVDKLYLATNLKHAAIPPYQPTEEQVQSARADRNFCNSEMAKHSLFVLKTADDDVATRTKRKEEEKTKPPVIEIDPNLVTDYTITAQDLAEIDQEILGFKVALGARSSKAWVGILKHATKTLKPMLAEKTKKDGANWMRYTSYNKGLTQGDASSFHVDGRKAKYVIVFFSYGLQQKIEIKGEFKGKVEGTQQVTGHTCVIDPTCGINTLCYTPCGGTIEKGKDYMWEVGFFIQNKVALSKGLHLWTILRDNSE